MSIRWPDRLGASSPPPTPPAVGPPLRLHVLPPIGKTYERRVLRKLPLEALRKLAREAGVHWLAVQGLTRAKLIERLERTVK